MALKRVVLLLAAAVELCPAQQRNDLRSLLDATATFAREGISWRAEGSLVTSAADAKEQSTEQFKIAYRLKPVGQARLEVTTGPNPLLRICDGNSQWTYYAKTKSYIRVVLPQIGPCAEPINAWPLLSFNLKSPQLAGTERLTFRGSPLDCQKIRGTDGDVCIDPSTKLIARYQVTTKLPPLQVRTYTFSSVERNVDLDPDLFVFHPPPGSREIGVINWLEPGLQPNGDAVLISNQIRPPTPIRVVAPESSPGSPGGRASGAVGLYVEVSEAGIPRDVRVIRSLRPALDEKAIDAVKQWRFEPSVKPLVTAITVDFYEP